MKKQFVDFRNTMPTLASFLFSDEPYRLRNLSLSSRLDYEIIESGKDTPPVGQICT